MNEIPFGPEKKGWREGWRGLRAFLQCVQADQMRVADPGGGQEAIGGNEKGCRDQWQFHDVTSCEDGIRGPEVPIRATPRPACLSGQTGKQLRLEFILGQGRINLKMSPVISVTTGNNFLVEMTGKSKNP
ncbi:hypothetical protein [Herbaspirillum sp. SJZ099]|uniref:hypothetical protein n=1 Tax=Herbaspirillum sp. SJZ099 TaxID=2572916 RepID=UPI001647443E|nr:hypothetical protein [Herbaspirillum sp. SJZ099]